MKELLGSAWIEINLDAIGQNIKNLRSFLDNKVEIMGIVKGNAYGHDSVEVSKTIIENGIKQLAVARIEEAIILRKNNIPVPILVLSVSLKEQMHLYLDYNIMPTISDLETAEEYNRIANESMKKIEIHLKLETGMGRIGINPEKIVNVLKEIKEMKNIDIKGIYTHFSTADENDKEYTNYQFKIFSNTMNEIKKNNISIQFYHVANSGAIVDLPNMWLDLVRPGCLLYGLYPCNSEKQNIELNQVLTFKSRIAFIKKLKKNKYVGYGKTYKTTKDTLVATLPVGYADGYPRLFSNKGKVLVNGFEVPVIGKVCMDQMMINVSGIPQVEVGDEVVLWGKQKEKTIKIRSIANSLNTIVDEVVHLTDKERVAKLFIKDGKPWKIKNLLGEYYIND